MNVQKISILIVNYNRLDYLKGTIASIREHTEWPFHLYIWDNDSTEEGVKDYLDKIDQKDDVTVFHSPKNVGIWKASNELISRAANVETLGFIKMDNDCIIKTQGWARKWIECCNVNKEVGMIGANIEGKKSRSADIDPLTLKGHKVFSLTREGTGGAVYVPGRTFCSLGFYNEEYGRYGHADKDYARRVFCMGRKFVYHCDVEVDRFAVNNDDNVGGYREHKNMYLRRNRRLYVLNRYKYQRKIRPLAIWYRKFQKSIPKSVRRDPMFAWTETNSVVHWDTGKVSQYIRDEIEKYKLEKIKR